MPGFDQTDSAFEAETIVVTGASRGLGRELAMQLVQQGHCVIALAKHQAGLETLDDELRAVTNSAGTVVLAPVDLADPKQVAAFGGGLWQRFPTIDRLFHCAWQQHTATRLAERTAKQWDQIWHVNLRGLLLMIQALDPLLRAARAPKVVVPMAAVDQQFPRPFWGADSMVHAALDATLATYALEHPQCQIHLLDLPPMATRGRAVTHPGSVATAESPSTVARDVLEYMTTGANPHRFPQIRAHGATGQSASKIAS